MGASFDFQRYRAFGWVIHRKSLRAGEQFEVQIGAAYPLSKTGNISLWTRGRVTGIDRLTGLPTLEKVPGHSVLQRDVVPQADCLFTAQEDSEFWCMNRTINRNRLPDVAVVSAQPGEPLDVPAGARVLVCAGAFCTSAGDLVEGPVAVQINNPIVAVEPIYGLIFKD